MLRTVFQVKGVDEGCKGIQGKDITEDLAEFVYP